MRASESLNHQLYLMMLIMRLTAPVELRFSRGVLTLSLLMAANAIVL